MSRKLLSFLLFNLAFQIFFYKGIQGYSIFFATFTWTILFYLNRKDGHHPLVNILAIFNLAFSGFTATHPHHIMDGVNAIHQLSLVDLS